MLSTVCCELENVCMLLHGLFVFNIGKCSQWEPVILFISINLCGENGSVFCEVKGEVLCTA